MKLDTSLLSHCNAIIGKIAPELRNASIVSDEVFSGLSMPRGCCGYALESDKVLFDLSERIDGYKAGSPVICLCADAIAAESGSDGFRDAVLGVLIHEAAHLLPRPPAEQTAPDLRYLDCDLVRARLDEKRSEALSKPEPPPDSPDAVHDWRFLRRCVHLRGRTQLGGWDLPCDNILGDPYWFTVQLPHWTVTLLAEIFEHRHSSFAVIEAAEPPARFMSMWRHALSTFDRFKEQMK